MFIQPFFTIGITMDIMLMFSAFVKNLKGHAIFIKKGISYRKKLMPKKRICYIKNFLPMANVTKFIEENVIERGGHQTGQ